MIFAERLKAFREEKRLSQAALADLANVPIGTIRDYEQGRREPGLKVAVNLAAALKVTVDQLAGLVSTATAIEALYERAAPLLDELDSGGRAHECQMAPVEIRKIAVKLRRLLKPDYQPPRTRK